MARSKAIDDYIASRPEWAQPILEKIRTAYHKGCPEVEEAIKWGTPHFSYQGMLGGVASFKAHVSFGFWKGKLMADPEGLFVTSENKGESMCVCKVPTLKDLPPQKVLVAYVKEAVKLNEEGVKLERKPATKAASSDLPEELAAALGRDRKAKKVFEAFPPSHQREYIEWIAEAKRPETREKRVLQALEWISEGKPRNWKYMDKYKNA